MFAVALWTESERRLVLARDRMGIKPLYIARQRRGPLLRLRAEGDPHSSGDRAPAEPGRPGLLSVAELCARARGRWWKASRKLLPGHWLEWRNGAGSRRSYWQLAGSAIPAHRTLESAQEEFDSLLRQSVREHLLSDVPLGVWLSGGVDSSTILHYAAKASQLAAEDILDLVPRTQLRRDAVHSSKWPRVRHRARAVRPESRAGLAGRDRGVRLLLRRAQRRCRRAAGLVPLEAVQDAERRSR